MTGFGAQFTVPPLAATASADTGTVISTKFAVTVHAAVIGAVMKGLVDEPTPPQPLMPPLAVGEMALTAGPGAADATNGAITYPGAGVATQLAVAPKVTGLGVQTTAPPLAGDATVVIAKLLGLNAAITAQFATIAFAVYVVPTRLPPQVPPIEAEKPLDGATVNVGWAPDATVCVDAGVMVPLLPETLEVTV